MTFPPLDLPSVSQSIVTHIEDLILDGILVSGSRLPSERRLSEALNVSRNSLREALAKLKARGIIEFDGRTTRVASIFDIMISGPREDLFAADADDTVAFWQLLNGFNARLAAARATAPDKTEMRVLLTEFKTLLQKGEAARAATALGALARQISASGYNFVFQQVLSNYLAGFEPLLAKAIKALQKDEPRRLRFAAFLDATVDAIIDGQVSTAEADAVAGWAELDLGQFAEPRSSFATSRPAGEGTVAEQASHKLTRHLKCMDLHPGTPLPATGHLARSLSLSVNAVTLASSRLEALGVLESDRQGGYVFLSDEPARPSGPLVEMMQKRERAKEAVFEFRLMLEEEAAARAALNRSEAQLKTLRNRLQQMECAMSSPAPLYSEGDMAFHKEIAAAGGNEALYRTLAVLNRFFSAFTMDWLAEHQRTKGNLRPIHTQHMAVFDAIAAGEPEAARAAMGAHLGYVIAMMRDFASRKALDAIAERRLSMR